MARPSLTATELERMATLYAETLSIGKTARAMGIAFTTVQKYVEVGDSKRGIPAIKDVLAERIRARADVPPPQERIRYSVDKAFEGSTHILQLLKSLFSAKFGSMLQQLEDAYRSGDAVAIKAAETAIFPHIHIKDVPRVFVAEAVLFEKMGPKEQGGGANRPLPDNVSDELDEIMDELTAVGAVVEDGEDMLGDRKDDVPEDD